MFRRLLRWCWQQVRRAGRLVARYRAWVHYYNSLGEDDPEYPGRPHDW